MKKLLTVFAILIALMFVFSGCAKKGGESADSQGTESKKESAVSDEIAVMETDFGTMVIEFYPDVAPKHVERFKELAREGFYEGILFHRVIPGFVIQAGDPGTKDPETPRQMHGTGGTGQKLKAEFNERKHLRGTLSMARSQDPNSGDSQFFICLDPQPMLDNKYTVFGQVIEGMEVADNIAAVERDRRDNPVEPVAIKKVTIKKAD